MSNWIDVHLDVLASTPAEINEIETALRHPCADLIVWRAKLSGMEPTDIAEHVKEVVAFRAIKNLRCVDTSVNKARRFESSWSVKYWGLVWSHVYFVSRDFPKAIFLAEYWDEQMSYAGMYVIRAGEEIRSSRDRHQRAQAEEWVLPNIFAPYQAEYERGFEFGSLWNDWVDEMQKELAELKRVYAGPEAVAEPTNSQLSGE
jgi:hypothetical protein